MTTEYTLPYDPFLLLERASNTHSYSENGQQILWRGAGVNGSLILDGHQGKPDVEDEVTKGVSSEQAALIHSLLGEAFETSLRTQLQSGEFNAAILGKVLEWLKHNNVSVVESADDRLQALANVFRKDDSLLNYLDEVRSSEL